MLRSDRAKLSKNGSFFKCNKILKNYPIGFWESKARNRAEGNNMKTPAIARKINGGSKIWGSLQLTQQPEKL
jgi:hypothetical protein